MATLSPRSLPAIGMSTKILRTNEAARHVPFCPKAGPLLRGDLLPGRPCGHDLGRRRTGRRRFLQGRDSGEHRTLHAAGRRLPLGRGPRSPRRAFVEPISTDYRGVRVYEIPPPGQGVAALESLNILEGFELASAEPSSADRIHLEVEAKKLAFEDLHGRIGDLNSPTYLRDACSRKNTPQNCAGRSPATPQSVWPSPHRGRYNLPLRRRRGGQRLLVHKQPL